MNKLQIIPQENGTYKFLLNGVEVQCVTEFELKITEVGSGQAVFTIDVKLVDEVPIPSKKEFI